MRVKKEVALTVGVVEPRIDGVDEQENAEKGESPHLMSSGLKLRHEE